MSEKGNKRMKPGIPKITLVTSSYNIVLYDLEEEYIEIKTTVTNDHYEVMTWIKNSVVIGEAMLGLEVQCCRRDLSTSLKPAILTVCDGYRCLILQLGNLGNKRLVDLYIKNLLLNQVKGFVGANVERSEAMLKQEYGFNIGPCQNISQITRERECRMNSTDHERIVSKLMMDLIVMRKMPEVEAAVWEKQKLDEDLVAYATLESYLYYIIAAGHKAL